MGRVVRDTELAAKNFANPFPRPALAAEAPGLGAPAEQGGHLGLLVRREPGHSPRPRPVVEGGFALLASAGEPLADRPVGDPQGNGNLADRPALLVERPSPKAAAFPPTGRFLRCFAAHTRELPMTAGRYTSTHGSVVTIRARPHRSYQSAAGGIGDRSGVGDGELPILQRLAH